MKPRLLDLFCCAGGAGMGYHRAGFEVVGVDIEPQPRYPFEFHQADALEYIAEHGHEFDAIHASPPCQGYSRAQRVWKNVKENPLMIADVREALKATGKPYVIENVEFSELRAQLMLCGTMFGLKTRRHRYFESSFDLFFSPFSCSCAGRTARGELLNYHNTGDRNLYLKKNGIKSGSLAHKMALGVEWMNFDESQEAIPPAYTEFIGRQLLQVLEVA